MIDEFNLQCSKCSEHGNLFCRLCQRRYCWDHACWHLNTAQQSYSQSLDSPEGLKKARDPELEQSYECEEGENDDSSVSAGEIVAEEANENLPSPMALDSQNNVPPSEIPTEQLHILYQRAIATARGYRIELERRAYAFERTYFGAQGEYKEPRQKVPKPVKQSRGMAKSKVMALEYLARQVQLGNLKLEDVEKRLNVK